MEQATRSAIGSGWTDGTISGVDARTAVSRSPDVVHGATVFAGTRVPVATLFAYLEHGLTVDDFLHE